METQELFRTDIRKGHMQGDYSDRMKQIWFGLFEIFVGPDDVTIMISKDLTGAG